MPEHRGSYQGYFLEYEGNKPEDKLFRRFMKSNILNGLFVAQFPLIYHNAREVPDAICIEKPSEDYAHITRPIKLKARAKKYNLENLARGNEGDTIWIVEVKVGNKRALKYAVGQILVYANLFSKLYPKYKVKKAIISNKSREDIEELCKILDIERFIV